MLQYETIFVAEPGMTDDEVDAVARAVEQSVGSAGGKVLKTEKWGKRRLAYPIGHKDEGIYVLMTLECPQTHIRELDRRYRMNDRILRHLTVRVEDESQLGPSPMMKPRPTDRDEPPVDLAAAP